MAARIYYNNKQFTIDTNETVLDCLLREKQDIPHSCKAGVCQSCLMQALEGEIPVKAQQGLKPTFKQRKLFMACQCILHNDITLQLPDAQGISVPASIIEKNKLNHTVLQLKLTLEGAFECQPGQYLTMINPNQVARSYSIANHPIKEGFIELHIRIIPGGKMSVWLEEEAETGSHVMLRGPAGNCFYPADDGNDFPMVLAGTGTGLAPLYGIAVDALKHHHQGNIWLYHGALREQDLYFTRELKKLAAENNNFIYTACVLQGEERAFYQLGNIEHIVMADMRENMATTRLYLCGAPELVKSLKTKAFLAGIASKHIYADAFLPSKQQNY